MVITPMILSIVLVVLTLVADCMFVSSVESVVKNSRYSAYNKIVVSLAFGFIAICINATTGYLVSTFIQKLQGM